MASSVGKVRPEELSGKLGNGTYENSTYGISYPLPDGFFEVSRNGKLGPAQVLLIADRHTGTAIKERILVAVDPNKYTYDYSVYTRRFTHAVTQQNRANVIREREEGFGGHRFSTVEYNQSDSGVVLYKAFACTENRGQFVMWVFASASRERVSILLSSLEKIRFK